MKKAIKTLIFPVLLMVLCFPFAAFASELNMESDMNQLVIGSTVSVSITVSGENIAIANGTFNYDHTLLKYVSSKGGVSDGNFDLVSLQKGGASSLTAVIEFEAISAGTTDIVVSIDNILDYDGKPLSEASGSFRIEVLTNSGAATPDTETDFNQPFVLDGIAAVNVVNATTPLYVWRSVLNLTLPSGFSDTSVTYGGETISAATNGADVPTILVYVSDENGENADYYVFDETGNTLTPYVPASSSAESFVFLWPDETLLPPDGYVATTLVYDEEAVPAWAKADSDGTAYLVYVKNEAGEKAFYQYLPSDDSFQRFLMVAKEAEPETDDTLIVTTLYIVCGVLFVGLIALIILYVLALKEKDAVIAHSKQKLRELKKQ